MAEGRHASSSRIKPAYLIGGAVALVVIVLAVKMLGGGGGHSLLGGGGPTTPKFAFETTKVVAVPTRADATASKLQGKAKGPAAEVAKAMDALYIEAFLNPDNWQNGSYDSVWGLFDQGAAAEAQQQVDTVTAGSGAGAAFDTILPDSGTLKVKVLLDPRDEPYSAVAIVRFQATGALKNGGQDLVMTSEGQYVLQKVNGTWKVVSFRVVRNNVQQQPSPSTSASGSSS